MGPRIMSQLWAWLRRAGFNSDSLPSMGDGANLVFRMVLCICIDYIFRANYGDSDRDLQSDRHPEEGTDSAETMQL